MALLLQTAIDAGALSEFDYTHVKIMRVSVQPADKRLTFEVEFGAVQNGEWSSGRFQPMVTRLFCIQDAPPDAADFTDMMAELPTSGEEKIYDGVSRVLYQWLLDNDHFDGTID
jgi:hypothetical protein